jgi:hypothetical protein
MTESRSSLPHSMRYVMGRVPSVSATSSQRLFAASNGNSFNAVTNEIRIPVSAHDGFLDVKRGYLAFNLSALGATDTYDCTLSSDGAGVFDSIRIESQGRLLERLERYCVRHNVRNRLDCGLVAQNRRSVMLDGPTPALAQAVAGQVLEATDNSYDMVLEIEDSGFLNPHDGMAIPMGCAFDIIIRINPTVLQGAWTTGDPALGLSVINPRFIAPLYKIQNADALAAYKTHHQSQGVSWSGDTYKCYVGAITQGATGENIIQINDRSLSLLSLCAVQRTAADRASGGSKSTFGHNGCTEFYYEIDGQAYPSSQIKVDSTAATAILARAYKEMVNSSFVKDVVGPSKVSFLANSFIMCVDLKVFDDELLALRGMNTAQNASPNTFNFTASGGATAATEVCVFANCEAFWTLQTDGQISVVV